MDQEDWSGGGQRGLRESKLSDQPANGERQKLGRQKGRRCEMKIYDAAEQDKTTRFNGARQA